MAATPCTLSWRTVALTGGTAATVGSIQAPTNQAVRVTETRVSHDGSTSTNAPDVTDCGRISFATGGTGSSTTPLKKDADRQLTVQTTGKTAFSAEPTVWTVVETVNLPQYNGIYHYICPTGNPEIVPGGGGWGVRQNSPQGVNSSGKIEFSE